MRGTQVRRYYPSSPPTEGGGALLDWLRREFMSVFQGFEGQYRLPVRTAPPERLDEGLLVYADGVEWNPGGGKGVYVWTGTAWVKL